MKFCKCGCGKEIFGKSDFARGHNAKYAAQQKKNDEIKNSSTEEVTLAQMAEHIREAQKEKEIKTQVTPQIKPDEKATPSPAISPPAEPPKEPPKSAQEHISTTKYVLFLIMTNLLTATAVGLYLWRKYAP